MFVNFVNLKMGLWEVNRKYRTPHLGDVNLQNIGLNFGGGEKTLLKKWLWLLVMNLPMRLQNADCLVLIVNIV